MLAISLLWTLLSARARAGGVEYSALDLSTVRIFALEGVDKVEAESTKNKHHYTIAVPIAFYGSGFLVSADGLVLTARHVVEGARQIVVRKPGDRAIYPARVVYMDDREDFAFVSIGGKHENFVALPTTPTGLKVRQGVFAIGYPFDPAARRPQSTHGVIAGATKDGQYSLGISVNPGNSGGPLVDDAEHAVGIVVARGDPKRGAQGIGYAVPLDRAITRLPQISERHRRVAASLGAMSETERAFSGVVAALIEGHGADGMLADAARALRRFRESPLSRGMSDALSLPDADADLLTLGCAYHWNSAIVRRVLDDDSWQPEFKLAEQLCRNANKSDPEVAKRSPLVAFVVGGNQTPGTIGMTLDSSAFTMGQSPTRTAPKEIGGFKFGESVADATKACEGAKLAMTGNADSFRCSGPPVAVGFPAVVRLHFTEQRLSRIDLIWKLDGDDASPWLTHFDERARALEEAFGAPSRKIRSLPSECTESFAWCLSNKKVRLESAWLWYGDRSSASVKLDRVDGRPQLRVSYEGS